MGDAIWYVLHGIQPKIEHPLTQRRDLPVVAPCQGCIPFDSVELAQQLYHRESDILLNKAC